MTPSLFNVPEDSLLILDGDTITCPWCRLPVVEHPFSSNVRKDTGKEIGYFCLQKKATTTVAVMP